MHPPYVPKFQLQGKILIYKGQTACSVDKHTTRHHSFLSPFRFDKTRKMALASVFESLPLSTIAYSVIAIYLASKIAIITQRIFFHPLSRVPGPTICATSRAYEFWWDSIQHGRLWSRMPQLHKKYGTTSQIFSIFQLNRTVQVP